jgi:hypothetical protein
MPYCLQRLSDGRYIPLNRNYKPLGVQNYPWVDYEAHPSAARMKITPATAKKLSYDGSGDLDRIYFYNDGCVPTRGATHFRAYADRLAVFMKLKIEVP